MKTTPINRRVISPALHSLESKRQTIRETIRQYLILLVGGVGGLIFVILGKIKVWFSSYPESVPFILGAAAITGIIYAIYALWKTNQEFEQKVRVPAIRTIFKDLGLDWQFSPDTPINKELIKIAGFFLVKPTRITGKTLVSGTIDELKFSGSKIYCSRGHGKNKKELFHGLLLEWPSPQHVSGRVIIVPDTAQRLFGRKFGKQMQGWVSDRGVKLVYFGDGPFEDSFAVYAESETDARHLLTPAFRDRLNHIHQKFPKKVYFSFFGDQAMTGISRLNLFKIGPSHSINDSRTAEGVGNDAEVIKNLLLGLTDKDASS